MPLLRKHSRASAKNQSYLEYDITKTLTYTVAAVYVQLVVIVMIFEPFLELDCQYDSSQHEKISFHNPQFVYDPCRDHRETKLLGLTVAECSWGRRLVMAIVFGGFIGWERRNADRPAGVRTMALVSLGSCLFSICSTYAFLPGPMSWDSSRVSAAIPSGVGFLGSALIFKHTTNEEKAFHEVHGLTTAASVWLSAAVGIACAGGLYFVSSLTTAMVLVLLRFGPKGNYTDEEEDDMDEEDDGFGFMDPEKGDTRASLGVDTPTYHATSESELQRIMLPRAIPDSVGMSSRTITRSGGALSSTRHQRKHRPSLM